MSVADDDRRYRIQLADIINDTQELYDLHQLRGDFGSSISSLDTSDLPLLDESPLSNRRTEILDAFAAAPSLTELLENPPPILRSFQTVLISVLGSEIFEHVLNSFPPSLPGGSSSVRTIFLFLLGVIRDSQSPFVVVNWIF
jgi:hypothetical protein